MVPAPLVASLVQTVAPVQPETFLFLINAGCVNQRRVFDEAARAFMYCFLAGVEVVLHVQFSLSNACCWSSSHA